MATTFSSAPPRSALASEFLIDSTASAGLCWSSHVENCAADTPVRWCGSCAAGGNREKRCSNTVTRGRADTAADPSRDESSTKRSVRKPRRAVCGSRRRSGGKMFARRIVSSSAMSCSRRRASEPRCNRGNRSTANRACLRVISWVAGHQGTSHHAPVATTVWSLKRVMCRAGQRRCAGRRE